jgi:hypothetical protein
MTIAVPRYAVAAMPVDEEGFCAFYEQTARKLRAYLRSVFRMMWLWWTAFCGELLWDVEGRLLITAGLIIDNVPRMLDIDPGSDREGVLLIEVHSDQASTPALLFTIMEQLREHIMAVIVSTPVWS